MIDFGESEKVTAVLKLLYFCLNAWICLELSFIEIFFIFLLLLIYLTQKSWYFGVILTVTFLPPSYKNEIVYAARHRCSNNLRVIIFM